MEPNTRSPGVVLPQELLSERGLSTKFWDCVCELTARAWVSLWGWFWWVLFKHNQCAEGTTVLHFHPDKRQRSAAAGLKWNSPEFLEKHFLIGKALPGALPSAGLSEHLC